MIGRRGIVSDFYLKHNDIFGRLLIYALGSIRKASSLLCLDYENTPPWERGKKQPESV